MTADRCKNPFQITAPASLLFIDDMIDAADLRGPGHILLRGGSGTGKTTVLHNLLPEAMQARLGIGLEELPFLAVYVPLMRTNFNLPELQRLENRHASTMINEHLLVLHCLLHTVSALPELAADRFDALKGFYLDTFVPVLELEDRSGGCTNAAALTARMHMQLGRVWEQTIQYLQEGLFLPRIRPYTTALYEYGSHLVPVLGRLADALCPAGTPVYLLLDDAHCLSMTLTKILNFWMIARTGRRISLKITSDDRYKTHYAVNGAVVQTPFDYLELELPDQWEGDWESEEDAVYDHFARIVNARLAYAGVGGTAEDWFPADERYPYAGFAALSAVCSGSVRTLLELAGEMCDRAGGAGCIEPGIQEDVIRSAARRRYPDLRADGRLSGVTALLDHVADALRRNPEGHAFAFRIHGGVSSELEAVLKLGEQQGWLYRGELSRERIWFIDRMLAPAWGLDPCSLGAVAEIEAAALEDILGEVR